MYARRSRGEVTGVDAASPADSNQDPEFSFRFDWLEEVFTSDILTNVEMSTPNAQHHRKAHRSYVQNYSIYFHAISTQDEVKRL